jgi:hypothetical protein
MNRLAAPALGESFAVEIRAKADLGSGVLIRSQKQALDDASVPGERFHG